VLTLVEWYLPGEKAGGPVWTIDALAHRLAGRVHFDIVTHDRDLGDDSPYRDLPTGVWLDVAPERRLYLGRRDLRPLALLRLLRTTPHDVLYVNTLFSGPFALYPLIFRRAGLLRRNRLVLAPRGQLHPGALAIHPGRKRAYLAALGGLGLLRGVEWHASFDEEQGQIRRLDQRATVRVAPDLRRPVTRPAGSPSPTGSVRAVFLSRVSEKKNLDGALRMLGACTARVDLDIYGPQEDPSYWSACRALIAALPANVSCRYRGVVRHEDVATVFAEHDLLLFPTRGENFGHVVGEALEAGCLALVSDQTPWRGLAAEGAGWDLPLGDPAAFTAAIEEYARLPQPERARRRARAQAFAALRDGDERRVDASLRVLAGAAP